MVDEFKNLLNGNTQKQDSSTGSQRSDSVKPQEKTMQMQMQMRLLILNNRVLWVSSANISAETGEEKRSDLIELNRPDVETKMWLNYWKQRCGTKSPWPRFPGFYFNVQKPT
ncbi:hypothetical protein NC651_038927 [Populus alba x Populus x berolinensis]|nr:hypothetical protein NC651_038927 [Populus alba x Populus x berolinensis]